MVIVAQTRLRDFFCFPSSSLCAMRFSPLFASRRISSPASSKPYFLSPRTTTPQPSLTQHRSTHAFRATYHNIEVSQSHSLPSFNMTKLSTCAVANSSGKLPFPPSLSLVLRASDIVICSCRESFQRWERSWSWCDHSISGEGIW